MKKKTKLLVKKFLKIDLWQYASILTFICLIAFIFGKWIEAVCFCAAHCVLRPKFDKQYHSNNICMAITISVAFFGIIFTLPASVSLLSSIPIALFICWIGYIAADRLDLAIYSKQLEKKIKELFDKLKELEQVDIYSMCEEQLRNYSKSKGLSEVIIDTLILKVIHNYRWIDIQSERGYSKEGIRYHKEQILEKLALKKI